MGASAQASTHAGQKAEESQAHAYDDAGNRLHVQRVWEEEGMEQRSTQEDSWLPPESPA